MGNAKFIEVSAAVRYWEDTYVNGQEDSLGNLIPCSNGDLWEPVIDLENGQIQGWPHGTKADVHYKVCDQGQYWLLDGHMNRIAKWRGDYVPNDYLCHGDNGFGDYMIFEVNEDGKIEKWDRPGCNPEMWESLSDEGSRQ